MIDFVITFIELLKCFRLAGKEIMYTVYFLDSIHLDKTRINGCYNRGHFTLTFHIDS